MDHQHMCDVMYRVDIANDSLVANIIGRPFSIGSRIYLPKRWRGYDPIKQEAQVVYQISMCGNQGFSIIQSIIWYIKSFVSRKFRIISVMKATWDEMDHYAICRDVLIRYNVIVDKLTSIHGFPHRLAFDFVNRHQHGRKPDDWSKYYEEWRY